MVSSIDRSEIAFFDLETTVPTPGQFFSILEFGVILVCPRKLVELDSYETLVKPHDLSHITSLLDRANGITADSVALAPSFSDIADNVFNILNGRIWAGHNINRFDCVLLREAFAQINRPPPEPKGTIDSLPLLTQWFGTRAGDMKMASLANYFKLGKQTHRSLDDVRMNLKVLKYCAAVLFLESNLPDIFTENSWVSSKAALDGTNPPSSSRNSDNQNAPPNHPILSLATSGVGDQVQGQPEPTHAQPDQFELGPLVDKIGNEPIQSNEPMEEESSTVYASNTNTESTEFLEPNEVSIPSVTVTVVPFFRGPPKIQILHRDTPLQIRCNALRVRFGLGTRFVDHSGRLRLSFVVDSSPNLCSVLAACDNIANRFADSASNSKWIPVVNRKAEFYNSPTIRLQLPYLAGGDNVRWVTQIFQKDSSSSSIQQVVFNRYDVAELQTLIRPNSFVDAYFSLHLYEYNEKAGIRLVTKKLIVESN